MALSERDCPHGRQLGKCADCDLDHMEMAAAAEVRRVDELTALRKQDDALIRQMLDALTDIVEAGEEAWGKDRPCVRIGKETITAARARLGEKT